ncbi:MAG: SlyX family protein [Pseudolabrys sp.]|jgi:SlyX protein
MDDIAALNARLDTLEIGRAHQERAVEDLSEAVATQWKVIEQLRREIGRLAEQVREAAVAGPGEAEPPPPHY